MKNVSIVEQILVEDDSKKFISTRWTKDDPSRNSHDTVHFTSLNMSAKKPGKSQDVFLKISDGDLFFLGCNSIGKVVGLYHKLFANGSFLSRMEIVFKKEWLKNYYMNLDIITFLDAQNHIMERKSQAVLQELSKISSQKLVSRPIISCSICCKKFHILSEYMYHRFLCDNNKSSEQDEYSGDTLRPQQVLHNQRRRFFKEICSNRRTKQYLCKVREIGSCSGQPTSFRWYIR